MKDTRDKLIAKLEELVKVFDSMINWDEYHPSVSERQKLTGIQLEIATLKKEVERKDNEMYLNMQYYMEYCKFKGYVTPRKWIINHKHF